MIVGVGVDVVDLARFERALQRTPALISRLFAESEQLKDGQPMPLRSLAGRFAAKEALMGAGRFHGRAVARDMRVVNDSLGNPSFELHNSTRAIADGRGITAIHLSMAHDAGIAMAYVVAES